MMLRNNINVLQLEIKWLNKMVDPPVPNFKCTQIYVYWMRAVRGISCSIVYTVYVRSCLAVALII